MKHSKCRRLAGLLLGLSLCAMAQAQVTLKFAHYAEATHPANLAAQSFANKVEERTKGQVKVTVFPASALGSPPEQLQQVRLGAIDMGLPTQGALDKYQKAFAVVMLPFVFDNIAHAHRVMDGPAMQWLAPLAEKEGFVLLSNWEYGFRNLTNSKRPINKPEDVKGLKVRVPPEVQLEATMEALGANATKIAFPELYMALSQGVVDGEENPLAVIVHNKLYEVQKHLALTRHAYNAMVHVMSAKNWGKLTAEQQTIVREESRAAGAMMRQAIAAEEEGLLVRLQAAGVQITRPDTAPFRAAMGPAYTRIRAYAGDANVAQFMKMVDGERK
ncbi:MAG TPA: TRAP transporter substrate-binding protein [Burkholderiaceae bacterium]|nr:TRAP transporter substrate-binding protein [Burkholderiaceae bacterium]